MSLSMDTPLPSSLAERMYACMHVTMSVSRSRGEKGKERERGGEGRGKGAAKKKGTNVTEEIENYILYCSI